VAQNFLTIGALAERSGHHASALRYYEEVGLLKPAARVSGRRRYDPDAINQLGLIALLQDVGFTLAEIRSLLPHRDLARRRWEMLAHAKVEELDATIRKAQQAKRLLNETIDCRCTRLDGCQLVVAAGERRRTHRGSRRRLIPASRSMPARPGYSPR
jgi:MerR family redox-sensitive transcriptional activator SoxR